MFVIFNVFLCFYYYSYFVYIPILICGIYYFINPKNVLEVVFTFRKASGKS